MEKYLKSVSLCRLEKHQTLSSNKNNTLSPTLIRKVVLQP